MAEDYAQTLLKEFRLTAGASAEPDYAQTVLADFRAQPSTPAAAPDEPDYAQSVLEELRASEPKPSSPAVQAMQSRLSVDDPTQLSPLVEHIPQPPEPAQPVPEERTLQATGVGKTERINALRETLQTTEPGTPEYERAARDMQRLQQFRQSEIESAQALGTAEAVQDIARAPYVGAKRALTGLTLGASDIVFNQIEKAMGFKPGELEAKGIVEKAIGGFAQMLGAVLSGKAAVSKLGPLVSKLQLSPSKAQALTRAVTSAVTAGVSNLSQVVNGQQTAQEGIQRTLVSVGASLVGMAPETFVKSGYGNFFAQVATDLAYDTVTDAFITKDLQKGNVAEWFFTQELPQLAMSLVFARRDLADKDFETQRQAIKNDLIKTFKKDAATKAPKADAPRGAVRTEVPEAIPDEIRTVTRVAEDVTSPLRPEAMEARRTGAAAKEVRSIEAMRDQVAKQSDAELAVQATSGEVPTNKALAAMELMGRQEVGSVERQRLFDETIKTASDFGYALRTIAEIKTSTPEGAVDLIEKQLNKSGLTLTLKDTGSLLDLSEADIIARRNLHEAQRALRTNPTDENFQNVNIAEQKADLANEAFLRKAQAAMPRNVADTMFTLLQGRLLVPLSQVRNVAMNVLALPTRGLNNLGAATLDMINAKLRNQPREVAFPWEGSVAYMKQLGRSFKGLPRVLRTGRLPGDMKVAGEVSRSLHPVQGLVQFLTGKGLAVDAVTGKPRMRDRAQRLLEASGVDAEVMFRLLSAGDVIFRQPAEAKVLAQIGKLEGLRGKELEAFGRAPTAEGKAKAAEAGKEAVFTQDSLPVKATEAFFNTIARHVPGADKIVRSLTGTVYMRVPVNLAIEGIRYSVPEYSMAEGIARLAKGERAKALQSFGKAMTGVVMNSFAALLAQHGVIYGEPDKDSRVRSGQYAGPKPNKLNYSGLMRVMKGESPEWREGDELIEYPYLGFLGMVLQTHANATQAAFQDARREDEIFDPAQLGVMEKAGRRYASSLSSSMQLANMKGVQGLMDAVAKREFDNWFKQYVDQVASIPLPNTFKAMNRAMSDSIIQTRSENMRDTLVRVTAQKVPGAALFGILDDMPKIRDMWGYPVPSTPAGREPIAYHFFDFTKREKVPFHRESKIAWDVFNKTQNVSAFPSPPSRTVNGHRLTDRQYDKLIADVGLARRQLVLRTSADRKRWTKLPASAQLNRLRENYKTGFSRGKRALLRTYPQLRKKKEKT